MSTRQDPEAAKAAGTGSEDTGSEDTGSGDAGSEDAGSGGSSSEDTGSEDTGSEDTGPEDTGRGTAPERRASAAAKGRAWRAGRLPAARISARPDIPGDR